MKQARFPVDLHCHTLRSDGNLTPEGLISKAQEDGLKIIAITDHDIRPPLKYTLDDKDIHYSDVFRVSGVHIIPGIEISCQTEVEDVHLLCYGCDWEHEFFSHLETFTIESKVGAYRKLVELLGNHGMHLSFDEIIQKRGISESEIQKKHIFEEMANKGYIKSWNDAKIFVKEHTDLSIQREKPNPVEIIRSIHELDGIVILAHPYLIEENFVLSDRKYTRDEYIKELIDAGLDGLEIQYSYDKTSYTGTLKKEEIREDLLRQFGHLPLIFSGGSDYHADEVKGVKNPRVIGENGMTLEEFLKFEKLVRLIQA
jgi:3',5'-nucleoside bisphosphate phosphatase